MPWRLFLGVTAMGVGSSNVGARGREAAFGLQPLDLFSPLGGIAFDDRAEPRGSAAPAAAASKTAFRRIGQWLARLQLRPGRSATRR
ncbi:hypothetical protein METY_0049 [Methylopila sp. Yamaguchi]|nr:hypothetical protein METY_0049 [Methylopila sp. Yamaguchi]